MKWLKSRKNVLFVFQKCTFRFCDYILLKIREINAKITLSHSDFPRYKIKGFSEALDFLNERAVVGGHIDYGEDTFCALRREAREELGLEDFEARFLRRYIFESERERELVNAYRTTISSTPTPSDELDGGRFWSRTEIINSIGNGVFTPNFESEYMMLFNSGQNKL